MRSDRMSSATITAFASAFRPQDRRPVCEWAGEHVKPPGSARATRFDVAATPWLREPIEFSADNAVREQVLVMPTGAGKTTVFDAIVPRAIVEDPGSVLIGMQSDPDADEYFDERMEPILLGIEPIRQIVAGLPRNKRRKGEWIMPHMSFFCGGANKANAQRKSVRYVLLDEAWIIKHGLIEEFRARHHDRWNARVIIVSQGGMTHIDVAQERVQTELFAAWERTDRREWSYECPQCRTVQPFKLSFLRYETARREDGSIDDAAVTQSARYACAHCDTEFADTPMNRRMLADSGRYVVSNPSHLARHHGWHCNALSLHYVPWATLALQWIQANDAWGRGDREPRKIFIQKRLAEFWKDPEEDAEVLLEGSGYSKSEYSDGQLWEKETHRFMTIDKQRDHFWVVIRAWSPDGESRCIWEGRILLKEQVRALQLTFKVKDQCVWQDCGYEQGEVYEDCVRYGWRALRGDKANGFDLYNKNGKREVRFYSKPSQARAPGGGIAHWVAFANNPCKDLLAQYRAGRGPAWGIPDDVSHDWRRQMSSEYKKNVIEPSTKQVSTRWVKVASRPNHLWDCEVMQIALALIAKLIRGTEAHTDEQPELTPTPE